MIVSGRWWWRWKWVDWVDSTLLLIRSRLCTVFICRLCIDTCHFSPCSNAGRLHHNRNLRSSFRFRPVLKDAAHCSTRICASLFFFTVNKVEHLASYITILFVHNHVGLERISEKAARHNKGQVLSSYKTKEDIHFITALKTLRNHVGNLFFQS